MGFRCRHRPAAMHRFAETGLDVEQIKQRINDLAWSGEDPGFPAVRIVDSVERGGPICRFPGRQHQGPDQQTLQAARNPPPDPGWPFLC